MLPGVHLKTVTKVRNVRVVMLGLLLLHTRPSPSCVCSPVGECVRSCSPRYVYPSLLRSHKYKPPYFIRWTYKPPNNIPTTSATVHGHAESSNNLNCSKHLLPAKVKGDALLSCFLRRRRGPEDAGGREGLSAEQMLPICGRLDGT